MHPFPSYEEVRTSDPSARFLPIRLTPEAHRLFWTLQGPLPSAISVMPENWREKGSEPREPYMQANTPTDNGTPTALHPIAAASLTEPKISSITVRVYALDTWEQQWLESHEAHASPTRKDCQFGELPPDYEGDERRDESDVDSDEEEEDHGELLRCCGKDRPTKKWKLTVTPSPSDPATAAGCFVTVHDYVSAVHPWLMRLRGEIARADNVWDGNPPGYYDRMFVEHQAPDVLMTTNEASYTSGRRAGRPPANGPSYLEQLVAKAEAGDLEAAQKAHFQAVTVQRVPHGLSPGIIQALRNKNERAATAECEKGLRQVFEAFKRSIPDRSDEEIHEDMAEIREGMEESLAKTIESIRVHLI